MKNFRLTQDNSLLLIVDVQERLVPAVQSDTAEMLTRNLAILTQAATLFDVPIVVSEQYPKGLGHTVPEVGDLLVDHTAYPKMSFSCMQDERIRSVLNEHNRTHVVLCGIETHVCVLQTGLDLLHHDYAVHVISDAVGSRTERNRQTGLNLVQSAGGILSSTETAVFQWAERAGTEKFKELARLVR